jgi:iron complex outermembrane receptor protein
VTAWEAGAKTELLDSRLRLDATVFRSQFDEIQLVQRRFLEADAQTHLFIENGGEARIDGGEIELTALLGPVRFNGALGVVDAQYTRLHPEVAEVNRDSRFLHTPAATAALAADWAIDTAFGRLDLHLDHSWRDDVPFEYDPRSIARQDAYGLWNAMARLHLAGPGLCLGLWGRNLTDERYITRALGAGPIISAAPGDPKTWGMSIRYPCGRGRDS